MRALSTSVAVLMLPSLLEAQTPPPPTAPGPGAAKAEDNPLGWTARAAVSYVGTGGNAEASSAGLKFVLSHNWPRTHFTLTGSGVRADSTTTARFAVGPGPGDFAVVEVQDRKKTAENYALDATLDRTVTKRFYWQAGAGFLRNTFAGVTARLAARAGVGYVFSEPAARAQLKGALLATLTHQSEVAEDPATADTFAGLRVLLDFATAFGPDAKSTFQSRLALDENLQSTDDLRGTWWTSLGVSMTERLGLQVSVALSYDNLPALSLIDRYAAAAGGVPQGAPLGRVLVPLGKWDREVAVSLVLNLVPKRPAAPAPPAPPAK